MIDLQTLTRVAGRGNGRGAIGENSKAAEGLDKYASLSCPSYKGGSDWRDLKVVQGWLFTPALWKGNAGGLIVAKNTAGSTEVNDEQATKFWPFLNA